MISAEETKCGVLEFSLIQASLDTGGINCDIIKLVEENNNREGFSSCDEFGNAEWLPFDEMRFKFANENTELAFIGRRFKDLYNNEEWAIVQPKKESQLGII